MAFTFGIRFIGTMLLFAGCRNCLFMPWNVHTMYKCTCCAESHNDKPTTTYIQLDNVHFDKIIFDVT